MLLRIEYEPKRNCQPDSALSSRRCEPSGRVPHSNKERSLLDCARVSNIEVAEKARAPGEPGALRAFRSCDFLLEVKLSTELYDPAKVRIDYATESRVIDV